MTDPTSANKVKRTRPRDQYGRAYFAPNEIPPADEAFAHWRGKLTHPDAGHTPREKDHARECVGGWVPSGDWWRHCLRCRPVIEANR